MIIAQAGKERSNIMTYFRIMKVLLTLISLILCFVCLPVKGQTINYNALNAMSNKNASYIKIDIDTDTGNRGYLPLSNWSMTSYLDNLEDGSHAGYAEQGCYLFVNDNDDDADKIPDFAELNGNARETNIAPLLVSVSIGNSLSATELEKIKVSFEYDGATSIGTSSGEELSGKTVLNNDNYKYYPFSTTSSKKLYDYSPIRTGMKTLRIWKLHPSEPRNPDDIANSGGAYVVPSSSTTSKKYSLSELGFNTSTTTGTIKVMLYVEAINEANTGTYVTAKAYYDGIKTSEDTVKFTVLSGNITVNYNNDCKYIIDSNDDVAEDQEDGFLFWSLDSDKDPINSKNLENAFPLKIKFAEHPFQEYFVQLDLVKISDNTEAEYYYKNSLDDKLLTLQHLDDPNIGDETYLSWRTISGTSMSFDHTGYETTTVSGFKYTNPIIAIPVEGEYLLKLSTHFGATIDSVRIKILSVDKFFMFGSLRNKNNTSFDYQSDDTKITAITRFSDIIWDNTFASRNSNYDKYFIGVHGFNVNEEDAKISARTMFRRIYWQGFRGNFIAVTWYGDLGWPNEIFFNADVGNALHTSPALMLFLKNKVQGLYQAPADNISIMAHSLGNLVMWDALRLYRRTYSDIAVNDVLSYEPAIWIDSFLPQSPIRYLKSDGDDEVDYTEEDLKQQSWAFWFNQKIAGNSRAARDCISGSYYHSYNLNDSALFWMQQNDFYVNSIPWNHFYRINRTYRSPTNLQSVPALIKHGCRTRPFSYAALIPAGMVDNTSYADFQTLASGKGWDSSSHNDCKDKPLYEVSAWYKDTISKILAEWSMDR